MFNLSSFYLFIYLLLLLLLSIYIYKTEAFEAPTIFHVSTTFIYIYIYIILKKRNKVSTTFKKKTDRKSVV